jgi:hypothetical protein
VKESPTEQFETNSVWSQGATTRRIRRYVEEKQRSERPNSAEMRPRRFFHKLSALGISAALATSWSAPAWSQETIDSDPQPAAPQAPSEATAAQAGDAPTLESLQKRVEELELQQEDQEMEAFEATAGEMTSFKPTFSVYGFLTVSLMRAWISKNNILYNLMHDKLSFAISNVNLYFHSRMTQSLSAMVELYFTFAPQGRESYMPYGRLDTTVTESSTLRQHVLGGVAIERAQATWQRFDFLGVTVGRFITPYGVWNVEHGATVFLPLIPPYVMANHILPNAQTGLMIHGRFFPHSGIYLDYAITAANNRSDVEASLDFSDNKALGLRLQLRYEHPKFGVSLGGYGYWGQVDIQQKEEQIDLSVPTIHISSKSRDKHTELTGALDLVVTGYGVRLQAEYARSLVTYDVHAQRIAPYFDVVFEGSYIPDHVRSDGYLMLAYELPLEKLLGDMTLTPFILLEQSIAEDANKSSNAYDYRAGLNFKPSSYWVLKLEGSMMWAPDSVYLKSKIYYVGAQAAVSF